MDAGRTATGWDIEGNAIHLLSNEILHHDTPPSPNPQKPQMGRGLVMAPYHDALLCLDRDALNPKFKSRGLERPEAPAKGSEPPGAPLEEATMQCRGALTHILGLVHARWLSNNYSPLRAIC